MAYIQHIAKYLAYIQHVAYIFVGRILLNSYDCEAGTIVILILQIRKLRSNLPKITKQKIVELLYPT